MRHCLWLHDKERTSRTPRISRQVRLERQTARRRGLEARLNSSAPARPTHRLVRTSHEAMSQNPAYAARKQRTYPGRNLSDPKRRSPVALSPEAVLAELRTGT